MMIVMGGTKKSKTAKITSPPSYLIGCPEQESNLHARKDTTP